jgi:hypothetical protein
MRGCPSLPPDLACALWPTETRWHGKLFVPCHRAAFSIEGDQGATIWFDHGSADNAAGWGEPPRRPDVRVTFADMTIAYAAMRDEIDTLAAIGCCQIKVEGLVPLADGLNVVMERLRVYLQPA